MSYHSHLSCRKILILFTWWIEKKNIWNFWNFRKIKKTQNFRFFKKFNIFRKSEIFWEIQYFSKIWDFSKFSKNHSTLSLMENHYFSARQCRKTVRNHQATSPPTCIVIVIGLVIFFVDFWQIWSDSARNVRCVRTFKLRVVKLSMNSLSECQWSLPVRIFRFVAL